MTKYTRSPRFGKTLKGIGRNCLLLGSAALFALFVACKTDSEPADGPHEDRFAVTYSVSGTGGKLTATVKADKDGKSGQQALKSGETVAKGAEVTFTAEPNTGYKVAEWKGVQAEAGKNSVTVKIEEKTDVSVVFGAAAAYKIHYELDGGKNSEKNPQEYTSLTQLPITLEPATKEGANFLGWYTTGAFTEKVTEIAAGSKGDKTFYAKWQPTGENIASYTVRHHRQHTEDNGYDYTDAKLFGTKGADTSAQADTTAGFHLNTERHPNAKITQKPIAADGSTIVDIYYDRNTVTVSFDSDGGSSVDSVTGRFGAKLNKPADPKKDGHVFSGWADIPETFPAENATYKATWIEGQAIEYKVEHWFQKIDLATGKVADASKKDASYEKKESETKYGKPKDKTAAAAKTVAGFTAQTFEQKSLIKGASITVKVYYLRNEVTLTFDGAGGTPQKQMLKGKFGETIAENAIKQPKQQNKTLTGWAPERPVTFPTTDKTYTAQWKDEKSVSYKVLHLGQLLVGDNYDTAHPLKEEMLTGLAGAEVQAKAQMFEGFHISDARHPEQIVKGGKVRRLPTAKLAEDGSTALTVYYDRNVYTVKLDLNGGAGIADEISGRYQAVLLKPTNLKKEGFTFKGWEPPLPTQFLENSKHKAQWVEGVKPHYAVEHWTQKINADGKAADATQKDATHYEKQDSKTERLIGAAGKPTDAKASKDLYEHGFKMPVVVQQTVAADSSTVVRIYYERADITVKLNNDGGVPAMNELKGKFGEKIEKPTEPTKAGFNFGGWDGLPTHFPEKDTEYKAKWSTVPQVSYTVKHWKQKIDPATGKVIGEATGGANYEVAATDTESLRGAIGAQTVAKAKTAADAGYEGFTALPFSQQTIPASGTVSVDIYYTRNAVKLTFNSGADATPAAPQIFDGKYGEKLSAYKALTQPTKRKWIFKGWKSGSSVVPEVETFPASAAVYTAEWEKEPPLKYTVNHWQQRLGGNGKVIGTEHNPTNFEVVDAQTLEGERDATTNAVAKAYVGFITPATVTQKLITDGVVIDIYYLRNTITLNFKGNGGKLKRVLSRDSHGNATYSEAKDEIELTGKYGEKLDPNDDVPVPAAPDQLNENGDKFANWNKAPGTTFPAENKTFSAQWTALNKIEIVTEPTNKTYFVDTTDPLNREGLVVKAVYADSSSQPVTDKCTDNWSTVNKSSVGTQTVTLTYKTKTAMFDVEFKAKPAATFGVGDIIDNTGKKQKADAFAKENGKTYYVIVKADGTTYDAVRLVDEYDEVRIKTGNPANVYNGLIPSGSNDQPLNKAQMQATWAAKDKFFAAFDQFGLTIANADESDIKALKKAYCFYKVGAGFKFMKDNGSEGEDWELGPSAKVIPLVVRVFNK